jgi:DNA-binding MarR family transcriptional regulator
MQRTPSHAAVHAWARLVRVTDALRTAVEGELKANDYPPLAWYDALLELGRAPEGRLRPFELERHMLLPQYSTSRLVDRLERAGLVERLGCPSDKRGQFVAITEKGRDLQRRMWPVYAEAIERYVGAKLTDAEAERLSDLLGQLSDVCATARAGQADPTD